MWLPNLYVAPERSAGRPTAEQRLAAKCAAAAQARLDPPRRRRRLLTVGGPLAVMVVVVVAAVLVIVKVAPLRQPRSGQQASVAPTGVIAQVTSVPASVLDAVASAPPARLRSRSPRHS